MSSTDAKKLPQEELNQRYAKRKAEQRQADRIARAAAAQQKMRELKGLKPHHPFGIRNGRPRLVGRQ